MTELGAKGPRDVCVSEWPPIPAGRWAAPAWSLPSRTLASCEEPGLKAELATGTHIWANAHIRARRVLPGARVLVLFFIEI